MAKSSADISTKKLAAVKVDPGEKVVLSKIDPGSTVFKARENTAARLGELRTDLEYWQERLWAESKQSLLIVLQAMDTGGKDGATKNLMTGVNPAGVQVTSFKRPTELELRHDYLWRVHAAAPPKGYIGIWNRSHYEDVLVPVVHGWIDKDEAKRRYRQINEFERMLVLNGTTILKFFLHISPEEQKGRLLARLDDPKKHWKFNEGDLKERVKWPDYQAAYQSALRNCSSEEAPWYVIPADKKWSRDIEISEIVVKTLKKMAPDYPKVKLDVESLKLELG